MAMELTCPRRLGASGAHAQREQSLFFFVSNRPMRETPGSPVESAGIWLREMRHLSWLTPACLEAQRLSGAFGRFSGQGGGSVLGWEVSGAEAARAAASE